jgi:hypothetical protein
MERSELIERLVPLIPPPRAHQVRYHGILAPCASLRSRVVPAAGVEFERCASAAVSTVATDSGAAADLAPPVTGDARVPESEPTREDRPTDSTPRRLRWAALLQRVFEIDALRCSAADRCCG